MIAFIVVMSFIIAFWTFIYAVIEREIILGILCMITLFVLTFYMCNYDTNGKPYSTEVKSTELQDTIWITAHDGKISKYQPQTTFNEVSITDSLGEELLLIKVIVKK